MSVWIRLGLGCTVVVTYDYGITNKRTLTHHKNVVARQEQLLKTGGIKTKTTRGDLSDS
jgi:hypothetical protein